MAYPPSGSVVISGRSRNLAGMTHLSPALIFIAAHAFQRLPCAITREMSISTVLLRAACKLGLVLLTRDLTLHA